MEGKGFVEAQFLLAGDSLRLATDKEATVEEVWQEAQDEKVAFIGNENYLENYIEAVDQIH